jgi:hypothetical protein
VRAIQVTRAVGTTVLNSTRQMRETTDSKALMYVHTEHVRCESYKARSGKTVHRLRVRSGAGVAKSV